MKKHKFSERLPEVGKTIFCEMWRKNPQKSPFGTFDVFGFNGGIRLEANCCFVDGTENSDPNSYAIYFNEELPEALIWWADPEEED